MSRRPANPMLGRWFQHSPLRQHFGPRGRAKAAFATEAAAAERAAVMQRQPDASPRRPYKPYECDICKQWHVGRKAAP